MLPIYHLFLFAISPKEVGVRRQALAGQSDLHNFSVVFRQQHFYLHHFWQQFWNSLVIAVATGDHHAAGRDRGRLRDQPAQGEGRARRS